LAANVLAFLADVVAPSRIEGKNDYSYKGCRRPSNKGEFKIGLVFSIPKKREAR